MSEDIYVRLARHLHGLVMGYPYTDEILDLLRGMFTPEEAAVALGIPSDLLPFEVAGAGRVAAGCGLDEAAVSAALESMARKNVIFSGATPAGEPGYALLQVGYGMPQAFFWGGDQDERARDMARRVLGYFKVPVTRQVYGGVPTKTYKYSPASLAVDVPMQGVLPHEQMGAIVEAADRIALVHCPCRMSARILGRTDCQHSLEVCVKYDEMADFVLHRGLARQISKDEAMSVFEAGEREGLVHMVDNAQGEIKHTCNCCGHYCWNVGIIARRKIPRDAFMACYFIRRTEEDECIGCGACEDICPVSAVSVENDVAVVDTDWCIGCGVCAVPCPTEAITIVRREDKADRGPATTREMLETIKSERGL